MYVKRIKVNHKFFLQENCFGQYLLEFAVNSGDAENLIFFLSPSLDEPYFKIPSVDLKFKNKLFFAIKNETIFEHYIDVCDRQNNNTVTTHYKLFNVIFSLLEEHGCLHDIKGQVPFDKLLSKLTRKGSFESSDQTNVREIIDNLIETIMAYWSKDDSNFDLYSEKLKEYQLYPFFEVLISIIEGENLEDFTEKFVRNLKTVEEVCINQYTYKRGDRRKMEQYNWVLILAAILNNRDDIIKFILTNESIEGLILRYPPNIRNTETTKYFAIAMLENGYQLGNREIPRQWITAEKFKKFLDRRINYNGKNMIEVDCQFLSDVHLKKHLVKSEKDVDQQFLLWEDTKSLQYIIEDESLKDFIMHPTIATYIDLKMLKFQSIYVWNFLFSILLALSFGCLVFAHFQNWSKWKLYVTSTFCILFLIFRICRELFLYSVISRHQHKERGHFFKYIKIILPILKDYIFLISTLLIFVCWSDLHILFVESASVLMILLTIFELLATFRNTSMQFYFIMLKKVAGTFVKFFIASSLILIAFALSFKIFLNPDTSVGYKNSTMLPNAGNQSNKSEASQSDDVFKNFLLFSDAFLKIMLMLSGEFAIEPYTLKIHQSLLFFTYVITTFILFNLILGLTIDDVQKIKERAREIMLRQNAQSIIKISSYCYGLYNELYDRNNQKKENARYLKF